MSEAIAGLPPAPPPKPPRDAAAVILVRRQSSGLEVFWLEREQRLSFAGGFFAFPGGKLDDADQSIGVTGATDGRWVVAAARELFEETGLLVARGPVPAELDPLRRALLEGGSFGALLKSHQLSLHADDFREAGRWLTPPYLQTRFDARFFLVEAPAEQQASVWPGELASGEWIRPTEALHRWEAGSALLHPPNLHALQVMARDGSVDELRSPRWCDGFVARHLEFQRGVHVVPLETLTLPPATHTNAYVLGTGDLVLVDPGSADAPECDRLIQVVHELEQSGAKAIAIAATHHHGDHIGGLQYLATKLGLPVWAHARTADRLPVKVARLLNDGDVIELNGPLPMRWRVLHTPGHAAGHVCFIDERSRAGIVGDMVSTVSTIVIDPPEGDMGEYLRQLERLRQLPLGALYPSHGPVIAHGAAKCEEYLTHRAWREAKVLEAVRSFSMPSELQQIVERAYDDVASFVWPLAERNTVAILKKLEVEQRVIHEHDRYRGA